MRLPRALAPTALLLMSLSLGACGHSSESATSTNNAAPSAQGSSPQTEGSGPQTEGSGNNTVDGNASVSGTNNGASASTQGAGATDTDRTSTTQPAADGGTSTTGSTNTAPSSDTSTTSTGTGTGSGSSSGASSGSGTDSGSTSNPASGSGSNTSNGSNANGAEGSSGASGTVGSENTEQSPANTGGSDGATNGTGNSTNAPDTDGTQSQPSENTDDTPTAENPDSSPPTPKTALCPQVLAKNHALITGQDKHAEPVTVRPEPLASHEDPVYRSCVVRITDQAVKHPAQYQRTSAPRRQAFNADSSYFLLDTDDGYWVLYDAKTGARIKQLDGIEGDAEPQWDATDPKTLYFLPPAGAGMKIHRMNVDTGEPRIAADMGEQIRKHWGDATHASTIGRGSPSADGRYWCLWAGLSSANGGSWQPRGVFTWDMQAQRIVGNTDLDYRPLYVSTAPTGRYCIVGGNYDMGGTRVYKQDFSTPFSANTAEAFLKVSLDADDGELVLDAQGKDVYLGANYWTGEISMVDLEQANRIPLFKGFTDHTVAGFQFSGKAYGTPGWVLVTAYGERTKADRRYNLRGDDADRQWFHRKLFALSLSEQPEVKSIANLHNDYQPTGSWPIPNITVNRDFSRMLFNSTWASTDARDVDTYLVAIPPQAVSGKP